MVVENDHLNQRGERLQIMLSPEELAALDDFRFKHRMPSRAAAVRELLNLGLASITTGATAGLRSSGYGVLGRGSALDGRNEGHDGNARDGQSDIDGHVHKRRGRNEGHGSSGEGASGV